MTKSERDRHVKAVRVLTRWHFGRTRRRQAKKAPARDARTSRHWGWHENVVGIGVSWKQVNGKRHRDVPCVTFFVLRKEPKRRLLPRERIPECLELEGLDNGVLTDIVEMPGRFVAHAPRVRPIKPRSEVGHIRGGRGTLGPLVRKEGGTSVLALSCSHVLARSGNVADFGKQIEQPVGDEVTDVVGTLTDFSVIRSGVIVTADVALAILSVPTNPAVIGSGIVPDAFSMKKAAEFDEGTRTVLLGQVTNGARGEVVAFASTWDIDEMPFVNGLVQFSGLVAYRTRCAKGDSGGLVMSGKAGEESTILGLHTAGRSDGQMGLFQPIGPIMSRFKLRLVTE
jgi:hypothetical protein